MQWSQGNVHVADTTFGWRWGAVLGAVARAPGRAPPTAVRIGSGRWVVWSCVYMWRAMPLVGMAGGGGSCVGERAQAGKNGDKGWMAETERAIQNRAQPVCWTSRDAEPACDARGIGGVLGSGGGVQPSPPRGWDQHNAQEE